MCVVASRLSGNPRYANHLHRSYPADVGQRVSRLVGRVIPLPLPLVQIGAGALLAWPTRRETLTNINRTKNINTGYLLAGFPGLIDSQRYTSGNNSP